jgi:hypothetical protein
MRFVIFVAGCLAVLLAAAGDAADVTSRIIEREIYYSQPLAPCEVPSVVMWIARTAQIPAGIEKLPDDCLQLLPPSRSTDLRPQREKVYLTGKRIGEALNQLVSVDPRYAWTDSDGVIVVRPVAAWANRQHFLHRTIRSFAVTEQHIGVALDEWQRAVRNESGPPSESAPLRAARRTDEGNRPFSLMLGAAATAITALDDIIRAHSKAIWEVHYCQPFAEPKFATVYLWTTEPIRLESECRCREGSRPSTARVRMLAP